MSIKDYWIKQIQEVKEFQVIAETEDAELVSVAQEIEDLIDDQFIQIATVDGIARRERMLGIQPFADDTLDTRRTRVLLRWNAQLPYTYRQLQQQLNTLIGPTGYVMELNHGAYTLIVKVEISNKRVFQEVEHLVDAMAPANILVSVILLYNQHQDLTVYTHARLGLFTHDEIKNTDSFDVKYSRLEGKLVSKLEGVN